jgi:hypothetical protein
LNKLLFNILRLHFLLMMRYDIPKIQIQLHAFAVSSWIWRFLVFSQTRQSFSRSCLLILLAFILGMNGLEVCHRILVKRNCALYHSNLQQIAAVILHMNIDLLIRCNTWLTTKIDKNISVWFLLQQLNDPEKRCLLGFE